MKNHYKTLATQVPLFLVFAFSILSCKKESEEQLPLTVSTYTGKHGVVAGDKNGTLNEAEFNSPLDMVVDNNGIMYVADQGNNKIKKITPDGIVSTYAGTGVSGSMDGPAASATFYHPSSLAVDKHGNLFVVESDAGRVRKITTGGMVSTITGYEHIGGANCITVDKNDNLYITSVSASSVIKITSDGLASILAGSGTGGFADGKGTNARFSFPWGLTVLDNGNIYVADRGNQRIRLITPDGDVTSVAGHSQGDGSDGPREIASFYSPCDIAHDKNGNVYISDYGLHKIRKMTPDGTVSTYAGTGSESFHDAEALKASFLSPVGLCLDQKGSVFVADLQSHAIRRIGR